MKEDESKQLLNHLFQRVSGWLELVYICPPGVEIPGPHIVAEYYRIGLDKPDWSHITAMNAKGYSVYYGCTSKKQRPAAGHRSDERNTNMMSVLWCDLDLADGHYATKDAAFDALAHFRPVPTMIVDSGGGMHGLWRIEPMQVTAENHGLMKGLLRGIALAVQGDPHVAETARVFRLPGTVNTKPARLGAVCNLADGFVYDHRYTLDDFAAYRPLPTAPRPHVRIDVPEGLRFALPHWVTDYISRGAPEGERNNRLFAATIEYRANGFAMADAERDLRARALSDGLDEREIERTMHSAWKAPVGLPNVAPHIRTMMQVNGGVL